MMYTRTITKAVGSMLCITLAVSLLTTFTLLDECHALQSHSILRRYHHFGSGGPQLLTTTIKPSVVPSRSYHQPLSVAASEHTSTDSMIEDDDDDETLLQSIDPSTLQNLCSQYSLSTSGTKQEMLLRLREFANQQADADRRRRQGLNKRVEANLEGKARHTIMENEGFAFAPAVNKEDDIENDKDHEGYFYYEAAETEQEQKQKEEERRQKIKQVLASRKTQSSHPLAPPPPEDVTPNSKGERVVTVYSTTDKNDLTGMTSSSPLSDMSLENAQYQQKSLNQVESQPEESLIGGPFGDTSGSRRKKADETQVEYAKENIGELVRNLLATTGAPAFQDDLYDGDEEEDGAGGGDNNGGSNSFASPYGFTGFQPERIPPTLLSSPSISSSLRTNNGKTLKEVLSEYELQAIGHDGMAADDISQGGGHYREVTKVGSFLEGYRKAEERRVARVTSSMLLDRLVKEGIKGLDVLLAGMVREGDELSIAASSGEDGEGGVGELNGALVRYLDEAIREQEQRVKTTTKKKTTNEALSSNGAKEGEEDSSAADDLMWNVTRGEDGTIIETIDPNSPAVTQMLREELEKKLTTNNEASSSLPLMNDMMTVQEKMLLLLKLLRDRVKVEAVIGNDEHARNLRILAYCLKTTKDEDREQLMLEELGNSLDSLDVFSDLVTASIDYAESRNSNNNDSSPLSAVPTPPILDVSRLRKIKVIVERVKANQSWKASSGVSS